MYRPIVLIVLDGWGMSNKTQGNPIREGVLPTFDKLNRYYPMTTLQASGISVGLPWNTAGNSEVGHMTMGVGRVIYQNMPRISLAIQNGSFFKNPVLLESLAVVKKNKSRLHLAGLLSSGTVHSNRDHLIALLRMAKAEGVSEVFLHLFMDGRDSSPTAGIQQLRQLSRDMHLLGIGTIASLIGRNYAMDRNNNWDRVERAYRLLTEGQGEQAEDPLLALEHSYTKNITDEYIEPTVVHTGKQPAAIIQNGDALIMFNYREDRSRELASAFVTPDFTGFTRPKLDIHVTTLTEYERGQPTHVAFPPEEITQSLSEVLSASGKTQLRLAETEKYAHVTYFFNGGKEKAFPGEERILVPSPAVSHFDEIPEMSTPQITDKLIEHLKTDQFDFILVNYAAPDMVGHTGNEQAAIKAVEATDKSLSILIPAVLEKGGAILITADHGNVEEIKRSDTAEIDTEHSTNPVPLWLITPDNHREKSSEIMVREQNEVNGLLSDVAPTILALMDLKKPKEMNGASLLSVLR